MLSFGGVYGSASGALYTTHVWMEVLSEVIWWCLFGGASFLAVPLFWWCLFFGGASFLVVPLFWWCLFFGSASFGSACFDSFLHLLC